MLELLADALQVSIVELIKGEHAPKEQAPEEDFHAAFKNLIDTGGNSLGSSISAIVGVGYT